ncbi:hypothetical protein HHI36_009540, partial [Cryptolaemus montrouzieri]
AITKQHYLDSYDTVEQAVKRIKEVLTVHKKGGFEMVKWITSSVEIPNSIPESLRVTKSFANIGIEIFTFSPDTIKAEMLDDNQRSEPTLTFAGLII